MNISELYKLYLEHPNICTDSRKLKANSIFFALKGDYFNGNKFAENALRDGCSFAIIDEKEYARNKQSILVDDVLQTLQQLAQYHREQLKIPIIGITGTNGKTTSKELINCVLSQNFNVTATKDNLNNHIGVPLTLLGIKQEDEIAIIEMGANHRGEIAFLCALAQPNFGIITNIGKAHLEGFGNFQEVIKAKSELYDYIRGKSGTIFINEKDDVLLNLSAGIQKITYGESGDAKGLISKSNPFISVIFQNKTIHSNLIGDYQFYNIMLAICIGEHFKVSPENMKTAIENYTSTNNRSEILETKNNTLILDAYNANPSSMQAMLHSFSEQHYENKVCILGEMLELGDYSKREHQDIISLCNILGLNCYFIGNEFNNINNDSFKNRLIFEDFLKNNPISGKTILLKGSRGIGLENLVDLL